MSGVERVVSTAIMIWRRDSRGGSGGIPQGSGLGPHQDQNHQAAADGGVDHPEDVAEHVERRHQAELQRVVDHHIDEHDVARVLVEQAGSRDGWFSVESW